MNSARFSSLSTPCARLSLTPGPPLASGGMKTTPPTAAAIDTCVYRRDRPKLCRAAPIGCAAGQRDRKQRRQLQYRTDGSNNAEKAKRTCSRTQQQAQRMGQPKNNKRQGEDRDVRGSHRWNWSAGLESLSRLSLAMKPPNAESMCSNSCASSKNWVQIQQRSLPTSSRGIVDARGESSGHSREHAANVLNIGS